MLLVHLFVCFVHVSFCHFSFPLGVGVWLRFVTVALLDFSINFFAECLKEKSSFLYLCILPYTDISGRSAQHQLISGTYSTEV